MLHNGPVSQGAFLDGQSPFPLLKDWLTNVTLRISRHLIFLYTTHPKVHLFLRPPVLQRVIGFLFLMMNSDNISVKTNKRMIRNLTVWIISSCV